MVSSLTFQTPDDFTNSAVVALFPPGVFLARAPLVVYSIHLVSSKQSVTVARLGSALGESDVTRG
jgi:hypothetical protein